MSAPGAQITVSSLITDGEFAFLHYRGRIGDSGNGAAAAELYRLHAHEMIEHWDAFQPIPVAAANPHPMFGAFPKSLPMPCMEASPADRAIIAGFADLLYRKQNVRAAFQTYAAPEMIQHDPGLADGAEAAIDGLKPILSRPATHITIAHVLACRGMGVIHLPSRSGRNPGHITFDIMRIDGGKIVEHWNVIQPIASATISSRRPA